LSELYALLDGMEDGVLAWVSLYWQPNRKVRKRLMT
jgi:hypothetical protein